EGTDRCRIGSAACFERRNRRAAARLRQGADRHRAGCQSFEELPARRLRNRGVDRAIVVVRSPLFFIHIFHLFLWALPNLPQEAVTLICAIVHQESSAWIIQSLPKGYSLLIQQACCCL